jgi:SAM-dependent methyltransferase
MAAEFGTVAEWTAKAAVALGPDYYLPAACRGSGSPAALDWLIDSLDLSEGDLLLDCGAGVGGPAAYAMQRGTHPLLVEPEAEACRAAKALFSLPVVRAAGSDLPFADGVFDAAWALGVLCTTRDQTGMLTELRRVVRPAGRIGLLVYVATTELPKDKQPEGNSFPTMAALQDVVDRSALVIVDQMLAADLGDAPEDWQRRVDALEAELARAYGHQRAWQVAERQSDRIGELIANAEVRATLLSLRL